MSSRVPDIPARLSFLGTGCCNLSFPLFLCSFELRGRGRRLIDRNALTVVQSGHARTVFEIVPLEALNAKRMESGASLKSGPSLYLPLHSRPDIKKSFDAKDHQSIKRMTSSPSLYSCAEVKKPFAFEDERHSIKGMEAGTSRDSHEDDEVKLTPFNKTGAARRVLIHGALSHSSHGAIMY